MLPKFKEVYFISTSGENVRNLRAGEDITVLPPDGSLSASPSSGPHPSIHPSFLSRDIIMSSDRILLQNWDTFRLC